MKKVLLLFTKNSVDKQRADPTTLSSLLNYVGKNSNTVYEYALYENLLHVIEDNQAYILNTSTNTRLNDYDLVYQRRWGDAPDQSMACSIFLKKHKVPFIDKESDRPGAVSKVTQYWRLWEHDLPIPKTVYLPQDDAGEWIDKELEKSIGLPCVMKSDTGTRGQDNYLVKSIKQAHELINQNPDIRFIFQQYIPNDGDYRIIVGNNKPRLVIKRVAKNGLHTNNTSQGGIASLEPIKSIPEKALKASVKAAKAFKRDYAGVDLVFDKEQPDKFYFFEVNRAPQIEGSSFSKEKAKVINEYFQELIDYKRKV